MTAHADTPTSRREWLSRARESVFAKLVGIMITMASSLLLLVGGFFWFIVSPAIHNSIHPILEDYTRTVAATSPDLDEAMRLRSRVGMEIRYEGPGGTWATSTSLPAIAQVRAQPARGWWRFLRQRDHAIVAAPGGGAYLFLWDFGSRMQQIHNTLVLLLLSLMSGVVLTAYVVLTRLLRPLRTLGDGVARLGGGQLDVVLPGVTRDEFGRLTTAFNQMAGRVREMIGARDQLLLDVSHELRSPLTRMKVALELLPEGEQRTRMAADVSEMELMISELLELERLRGGRGLTTARRDLTAVVRDLAASFEKRPPGVRVLPAPREIFADIDAEKVRTVVRNLLENAMKYSPPHSRPVEVSIAETADSATIRVTDDGPGVPPEDVDRIFEPFFRVDRSRSKRTGGYGLGLSICKRVMEAHGGSITVEQQPGRGATFVLRFPRPRP